MLIQLVVTLIVIGVLLYLINDFVPMDGKIKQLVNVVVLLIAILYVLQSFGLISGRL